MSDKQLPRTPLGVRAQILRFLISRDDWGQVWNLSISDSQAGVLIDSTPDPNDLPFSLNHTIIQPLTPFFPLNPPGPYVRMIKGENRKATTGTVI